MKSGLPQANERLPLPSGIMDCRVKPGNNRIGQAASFSFTDANRLGTFHFHRQLRKLRGNSEAKSIDPQRRKPE